MGYSTSDPSEILDDAQHGIATNIATHGGVFLGEGHGYASITGWIADNITNLGIDKISIAVVPFVIAYVVVLIIISAFPEIATFLPDFFYGKFPGS